MYAINWVEVRNEAPELPKLPVILNITGISSAGGSKGPARLLGGAQGVPLWH